MQVSVIVPVYEQWRLIPGLVSAWAEQSCSTPTELIIVDNGSQALGVLPVIANLALVKCEIPGSYAARNKGLEIAKGELLIFTDADCVPDGNWIKTILEAYVQSDRRTLLAGNVIIRSGNIKPNTAELYDMVIGLPQKRYVAKGYAVTANLAIPRAVFDTIGLFDEQRFSGGDADFCQRAIRAGFKLEFIQNAFVYHPARKSWREYAIKVRRMKGGQIRAGKPMRKLKNFCITLIPPFWQIYRILKTGLSARQKLNVSLFQLTLWCVGLQEMFALLLGKKPERR